MNSSEPMAQPGPTTWATSRHHSRTDRKNHIRSLPSEPQRTQEWRHMAACRITFRTSQNARLHHHHFTAAYNIEHFCRKWDSDWLSTCCLYSADTIMLSQPLMRCIIIKSLTRMGYSPFIPDHTQYKPSYGFVQQALSFIHKARYNKNDYPYH